jgi:hypothetical protein
VTSYDLLVTSLGRFCGWTGSGIVLSQMPSVDLLSLGVVIKNNNRGLKMAERYLLCNLISC